MTPETLARINDLRQRVVAADEAQRAGDHERAIALMPSDDDIIAALRAARTERSTTVAAKAERATVKAKASAMSSIDVNALFE
jgi:hypothetical protein